jgi:hypothetical protein
MHVFHRDQGGVEAERFEDGATLFAEEGFAGVNGAGSGLGDLEFGLRRAFEMRRLSDRSMEMVRSGLVRARGAPRRTGRVSRATRRRAD